MTTLRQKLHTLLLLTIAISIAAVAVAGYMATITLIETKDNID